MLYLTAQREEQNAECIGRYHGGRRQHKRPTHMPRDESPPRGTVAPRTTGYMTRQEPRPNQKDSEEKCKDPEAKVRGPWPVFRQGAAEQQGSSEADCLRPHCDQRRTLRTFRTRELQNRRGRRTCREPDADAHQGPSGEYPPNVGC